MMNVLMVSPGFPAEMPFYTRGLSQVGVNVLGVGDQPQHALPQEAREGLSAYLQVPSLWNEQQLVARVREWTRDTPIQRVECQWEAAMIAAAHLREGLGTPGLNVQQTLPFRDKEIMKQVLDRAGIRTPRHWRARTAQNCRDAAAAIGYPLCIKPIAGAGSMDTHRINNDEELEAVLPALGHVEEVSVEEFIEGEEYTFDTVCIDGTIVFHNVAWYRPKPIIGRSVQWISPQTVTLRHPDQEELLCGREMGLQVLRALEFQTGFTHMEWFRTPKGEAVFGEIAARPPGAHSVDLMNYACNLDLFQGWAEAVCHGRFSQPIERRYNSAVIFKRAQGDGRIQRIEGLESLMARYGPDIVCVDLLPIGAHRRDWKATLLSDGYLIVRHPDLATTIEIADHVGTDLQIYAG
jgi:hypothetical protein